MRWEEWREQYYRIARTLELDPAKDREATAIMSSLIESIDPKPLLAKLQSSIEGQDIVVCGAGPSLGPALDRIAEDGHWEERVYVAADGATSAFLERGLGCDIIVTDLDGCVDDIRAMIHKKALGVVHAHGDNIDKLISRVPELGEVLASTQVEPLSNVFLWGGFTDGDRACYIVSHYHPRSVTLLGMDFGDVVGHWSKPGHNTDFIASERKRRKLEIAQELITNLRRRGVLPQPP